MRLQYPLITYLQTPAARSDAWSHAGSDSADSTRLYSGNWPISDPICTIFGSEMSTREQEHKMSADSRSQPRERLERSWATDEGWRGIERRYSADEVVGLRGSVEVEHSLARRGAEKLWRLVNGEGYVPALGAITGSQ